MGQQILILFSMHYDEMKQNGPLYLKSKSVKILDIVEQCVNCVLTFVKDSDSKRAILGLQSSSPLEEEFGVIDMLTDLLLILNTQLKNDPSQPMPPQGFDPMGGPPPPHMLQGPSGQFEGMFDDPNFGGNQDFYNMQ